MSILDSFDPTSMEIISPKAQIPPIPDFPETVIATFSDRVLAKMCELSPNTVVDELRAGRPVPIYQTTYRDKKIGYYHTFGGSCAAADLMEAMIAKGAKNLLFFGSCGVLEQGIAAGHYILPTAAYRDEGVSYHYAPPGDWLTVETAARLATVFDELHVPYLRGKTWTTECFYRETVGNMRKRKNDGCICVEMECASIMAVAAFRGVNAYQFLYAADTLAESGWDKRILGALPADMTERHVRIAFETAVRL